MIGGYFMLCDLKTKKGTKIITGSMTIDEINADAKLIPVGISVNIPQGSGNNGAIVQYGDEIILSYSASDYHYTAVSTTCFVNSKEKKQLSSVYAKCKVVAWIKNDTPGTVVARAR